MFEILLHDKFSLARLRNFLLVAEAGSISKAAPGDRVRQSMICRQIGELEECFHTELTERRGKGIVISPAGKRLIMLVRESFQSWEDFKKDQAAEAKEFSLASGSSGLNWLLVPCLHDLAAHLSGARLRLESHRSKSAVDAVREGTLDFAIVREDAVPAALPREKLGTVTFTFCVPKSLSSAGKGTWLSLPLATTIPGGQFRAALDAAATSEGTSLQPAIECGSFLEVRELVARGHYAGVLPSHGVGDLERHGVDVRPFTPLKNYGRALCLHWNKRQMTRRGVEESTVKALAVILRQTFKATQLS